MNYKRTLGPAILTVLALLAFGASSASAAKFTSETKAVVFSGAQGAGQSNLWTIDGANNNKTTCGSASYVSKLLNTPATLLLTPTFGSCTVLEYSEEKSTLEMRSCKFELLEPNVSLEGNDAIRCDPGDSIRFFGSGVGECEALIGETGNTNLPKATYSNLGGTPAKFEVKLALSGITVDKKKDGFFCNLSGTGVVTNGTFNATFTVGDPNKAIGVSVG